MFERDSDLIEAFICEYNMGLTPRISQYYQSSSCEKKMKMFKCVVVFCFVGVVALALPTSDNKAQPIHIINPPVRCPEGMKPDANGRCRVVWERSVDDLCPEGEEPDDEGICREVECIGEECFEVKKIQKRDVERETEAFRRFKPRRMEALKSEKKIKKRSNAEAAKQARSKHAFLIMLKKKKMQMMQPKPPQPPPPPHHPPHHHPPHRPPPEEEEPEEEEPAEEEATPAPERLFFGDEACVETGNSTGCTPDAELVEPNKEFKEWKPEKPSSESSDSSSSSSSSDSTGESESEGGSEESEDEVLEKAIKIKLMKLFRMKQRYGPALRRWFLNQLREYEDSLDE